MEIIMKLYIKKCKPNAKLPEKAHKTDAGFDLFSIERKEILPGETQLVKTGIVIQLPPNTEAQIRPRSGLALKHSITVLNSPGTIDEEYRGEIGVILINHGKAPFIVEPSMKIAQMIVKPILSVVIEELKEELSETVRGSGGFGSTGY